MATFVLGLSVHGAGQAGAQSPWGGGTVSLPSGAYRVRDMQYGGAGTVTGTVKVKGTPNNIPVARKVRLIRDVDAICIREVWSDAVTGEYTFSWVDQHVSYTVLSYDYTENFRAVVADRVVPT